MENILRLYSLGYDERFPVVYFDERSCFLIGDVVKGFEVKPEQVLKKKGRKIGMIYELV